MEAGVKSANPEPLPRPWELHAATHALAEQKATATISTASFAMLVNILVADTNANSVPKDQSV